MKATFTIERADISLLHSITGCRYWWELHLVTGGVPWVWKGYARSERSAERKVRRIMQQRHRAEVYRMNMKSIELYANGEQ